MKSTILFLLSLLLVNTTFAQPKIKDIPKGTIKIIITTTQSPNENYTQVLNLLLDNDFEIEKRDFELFTIKTGLKPLPKTGSYYLNLRCKDNTIQITGKFYSGISTEIYGVKSEDSVETIINKGMKGSIYKTAFIEMYKFTKKIEGTFIFK